ncbi:MAG: G5 domain-containing protein [Chloroflexi bacterium]|nr:G5 domain-containing protein [Chloroflexota bacterium]
MGKISPQKCLLIGLVFLLSACQSPQVEQPDIAVSVSVDGSTQQVTLPAGSTVQAALDAAALTLGQLDRISPPVYAALTDGTEIIITRVQEEYETRQEDIPFERQELPNESMPAGESRLIQAGQNGKSEITIRRVYEDGIQASESIVSETILKSPVPEILMVGVQNPFTAVTIPGKLVYLTGGNAWLMEGSTANRRPLVTSGDLDGRVFSLSHDGRWLLYSRKSNRPAEQEINTLWVVNVTGQNPLPIDLRVTNIVHFADWQPGENYIIAYSTVEPRATAPGWQANNDLYFLPFDAEKVEVGIPTQVLDSSSGGIYGWWGTAFVWSPDGNYLAYSRPDEIGLVDIENETLNPLLKITPLNTYADWAWIPGLAWGSDMRTLYFVTHAPATGLVSPEESQFFDLEAVSLSTGATAALSVQVGMFSYPSVSPIHNESGENAFEVAYLQAIFPSQSATSRYRLVVMDRDGSEPRTIFPGETQAGIEPQIPTWAPDGASGLIAILYDGNLWIIDTASGQAQQVTGDGLTSQLDWK